MIGLMIFLYFIEYPNNRRGERVMEKFNKEKCRKPAEKFKALGNPIRFWIVQQLLNGEHCVHEFVERTELDFSTISQHLNALRQAGILADEKRGKHVFYRLDCECVRKFLECVAEHMKKGCSKM